MSAFLSAYGRLTADPETRESATGKSFTTAKLAVDAGKERGAETLWLKLVAFGQSAEALGRHAKGEMISVMGRLQKSRWTDKAGVERENLELLADTILSARTSRPGPRRTDPARQADVAPRHPIEDDEIPFGGEVRR